MTSPATSIEYWCYDTAREIVRTLARQGVFRAIGTDNIKTVRPEAVISRYNRRPGKHGQSSGGERDLDLPGFIITYMGHTRPIQAGENCVDDGTLKLLVQLVDEGDDHDDTNAESYFNWMSTIRENLQGSALESCPTSLGQVLLTHVAESGSPDETDWALQENMRMALVVTCLTRTPR
ncbi:MAG: hypothetical protein GY826_33095 [Fuerstiella sp.]|jgi:hypothetical protein|nr:hypothetical protein [Fuerstiella sp.]